MKNFLLRALHGFTFGFGVAAALFVAFFIAERVSMPDWRDKAAADASKLSVTYSRDISTPKGRIIIGTVANSGPETSSYVPIKVDFFDAEGHLVDTCGDGVPGGLKTSATTTVKIECDDPEALTLHPHASFKIRFAPATDVPGP